MAQVAQNLGVTNIGAGPYQDPLISLECRQLDNITAKSTGGIILKGTLMKLNDDNSTYSEWDSAEDKIAGMLNEDVDTTDGDIITYLIIDADVAYNYLHAGTTVC
jgi:hypothetical protein